MARDLVSCAFATTHEARAIAVSAYCDPRSVIAYLKGGKLKATLASRIEAALLALGRPELIHKPNVAA
jgi:hypothetical protein